MIVFPGSKINLGLYVTDRRDDGYHNIETLFCPLGFADILEVIPDRGSSRGVIDLSLSGLKVEGFADTNLVVRAYRLLHEWQGLPGVKVFLHKRIPAGAGLGGGSSDGASMLLILNKLFDLNLSYCELSRFALKLGSDCPFFLDPEPSFARGRGEELKQASISLKGLYVLLFHSGAATSTADAYKYVPIAKPFLPVEEMVCLSIDVWKDILENVFEKYVFEQQPVVRFIKEELYRSGAKYASLTGSGSAVYGLFDCETEVPENLSDFFIWKGKL
jgi:4-diphosphocytidyl-2-C-methyl-D-erythritol kinase